MRCTMSRWVLVGALTLGALGAAAVFDVGTATADAAPSVSSFAGTYAWSTWPAPITISDGGRITSSYTGFSRTKGSISGKVNGDGSYSFTLSETFSDAPERGKPTWYTSKFDFAGSMTPDAVGSLAVTSDTIYGSFVWSRQ